MIYNSNIYKKILLTLPANHFFNIIFFNWIYKILGYTIFGNYLFCFSILRAQESHITISNIIEDLFLQVNNAACSRFIINRADVWDGAMRGFRRSNCEPQNSIMVKFTDDIGVTEEGIDTGGPKREFLGLLMDHLHKRPIFEGPETQRFLKYDATGNVFFLL